MVTKRISPDILWAGAIAAVLAIYLVNDKYTVEKVVTFGQPKFTTNAGVEKLGFLQVTRVVDENDIVPMLPPFTLINRTHGAYEHIGPEIILLDGPRYVFLPEHDADRISVGDFWRELSNCQSRRPSYGRTTSTVWQARQRTPSLFHTTNGKITSLHRRNSHLSHLWRELCNSCKA